MTSGTCAGDATYEDDEGAPLLEELGHHLVAVHVLVAKPARPQHIEQYRLEVLLQEHYHILLYTYPSFVIAGDVCVRAHQSDSTGWPQHPPAWAEGIAFATQCCNDLSAAAKAFMQTSADRQH